MPEVTGGGDTPWFFLSYAHARDASMVDPWVARFHADLSDALRRLVGAAEPAPQGFLDLPGESEDHRREWREQALSRCKALVALYSPDYFTDLECHSEWDAFHTRLRRQHADGGAGGAVVEVLWDRLWNDGPSQVTLDRRALSARFGDNGLRAALTKPRLHADYERAVGLVAGEILAAVEKVNLAADDSVLLDADPQPWEDHPPARSLRIQVLACTRRNAPRGADPSDYGERPELWQPYGSEAGKPVAQLAAEAARARNCHVTAVEDFEEAGLKARAKDEQVGGPQLLLLDRWALLDGRLRQLLLRYNEIQRHPMAVMVPWARRTLGAMEREHELQELTLTTLDSAVGRPKPDFEQLRRGIPDADSFTQQLPRAIDQARQAFFMSRRLRSGSAPSGPPAGREHLTPPS
jgi:FxsC-like protein